MGTLVLIAVLSYLLGSIPFGYLLVRFFRGEDVRQSGSGNIGATNVARKSAVLGGLTLLLDALKGSVAVAIGILLRPPLVLAVIYSHDLWYRSLPGANSTSAAKSAAIAALFAVLGHMCPVWLTFHGGKGVATGLGAFVMIAPKAVLVAAGIFIAVVSISRYVSLGSIAAVLAFPVSAYLLHEYGGTPVSLGLMSLASLLIIAKHHENIRRLLAGTENRLGSRRV